MIKEFIDAFQSSPAFHDRIAHYAAIPSRPSVSAQDDSPKSDAGSALPRNEFPSSTEEGRNILLSGESPSGKTTALHAAVLRELTGEREKTALYIFPARALVRNQKLIFEEQAGRSGFRGEVCALDGGTERVLRKKLIQSSRVVMTTPDMLHQYLLPGHIKFAGFFSRIGIVVIDDVHTYRGAWGTQCSLVFRRLIRILQFHGSYPRYYAATRPIEAAPRHAARLTGMEFTGVSLIRKSTGTRHLFFVSPASGLGLYGRSVHDDAGVLLADLVRRKIKSIVFARSWEAVENIYRKARRELDECTHNNADGIRAYRGGYLAEKRTEIEQELFTGKLGGIVTTNALEIGVHVPGLDACIIAGYPGSVSSFHQMAGRTGRDGGDSIVIMLGYPTAVNSYITHHPEYILESGRERVFIKPDNPYALSGQLLCAVYELPISISLAEIFAPGASGILEILREEKLVNRTGDSYYFASSRIPARDVSLRSLSRGSYRIVELVSGETIGFIDERLVQQLLHPGAIYLHDDTTYLSEKLDSEKKEAAVTEINAGYYTEPHMARSILSIDHIESILELPGGNLSFGEVTVRYTITGFNKIDAATGEITGQEELDLTPGELATASFWLTTKSNPLKSTANDEERGSFYSIVRGAGHALQIITSAAGYCNPLDIRDGYGWDCVFPIDPCTVFIFDNYPGGMGFSEAAFHEGESLISECIKVIKECPCRIGCPSCVGYQVRPLVSGDPARREGGIAKKDRVIAWFEELMDNSDGKGGAGAGVHTEGPADPLMSNLTRMNLRRKLLSNK